MDGWMDEWMDEWVDGWMVGWIQSKPVLMPFNQNQY